MKYAVYVVAFLLLTGVAMAQLGPGPAPGGGGAVTVAGGADVTEGTTADAAYAGSGNATVAAALKGIYTNLSAVTAAISAAALTPPLAIQGNASTDGSTTITTGGTAQNLFSGSTPAHGFEICNPGTTDDLWVSDSTTAAVNSTGSFRVALNGGCYSTPIGRLPIQAVSVYGATTGDKITARSW